MSTLLNPYFGEFGGMYVPQILMPALRQLEEAVRQRAERSGVSGGIYRSAEKLRRSSHGAD
ncbi:Tryptophan synthase beta chain [Raoultella planticola]|uniref:Tryptophan synthase beta chain n=1 Tax=Raoultella planticola TaxID=575 RepID=A0A485CR58_RAOPL|nr:Tryptophan synthase beta chain [Raoultella planticola]